MRAVLSRYAARRMNARKQSTAALTLLALGIVYGDIGTSPLYAVKETFNPANGIPLTAPNILGGASAIFWAVLGARSTACTSVTLIPTSVVDR